MDTNRPSPPDEADLDETIEETFPASDPPANTVETGVHIDRAPDEVEEDEHGSRGGA
jgi:hypothetical protein